MRVAVVSSPLAFRGGRWPKMSSVLKKALALLKHAFNAVSRRSDGESMYEDPLCGADLGVGDTAIDCGANVGKVTARMARTGAVVYAFEPNPYAYGVLRQRMKRFPDVHCINRGVLDRDGVMRLYLHENAGEDQVHWSTGSSLLEFKGNFNPETYVEIEVVDLTRFIVELDRFIEVIKMDVEGVECQIVNKLIDTGLVERIGLLLVETHEGKIPELIEPTERLRRRIAKEGLTNIRLDWV